MPQRSFSAQDLVALPTLSAVETMAVVQQLETRAKDHKLPADVADALAELSACRDALMIAQQKKRSELVPASPEAIEADRAVDRAWGAMSEWLGGWTRLADAKHAPHASALTGALFPDGLAFINLPYLGEWTESELRLRTIREKKLEVHFEALGGTAFLKAALQAHDAYGKALGITQSAKGPAPVPADVRAALDATRETLREYVAKVAAIASRKKPKTLETVAALLEPLTSRETRRRAPVAPPEPPPGPPAV